MDFMNQKVIDISTVNFLILDEVDRMLDMGFVRDIKKIRAQMHNIKQTYTFSATINNDIKTIIKEHVSEYEFIKI
jgi:ATP-dependent RNA helicase RhlE